MNDMADVARKNLKQDFGQMLNTIWVMSSAVWLILSTVSPCVAADTFTKYGNAGRFALPIGAAALAVLKDDTEGLKQLALSGGVTLGATYGLKYSIDARRPNGSAHSFPSGHASSAFVGASFIFRRYGWQWGLPAELAATAVAISRVEANAHHWRDVAASATIAHASAYFFADRFVLGVTLVPVATASSLGIIGRIRF